MPTRTPSGNRWHVACALVGPFVWLDGRVPSLRRHGYLLASVGVKVQAGVEYLVDAHDCDPAALRSLSGLPRLFADIVGDIPKRGWPRSISIAVAVPPCGAGTRNFTAAGRATRQRARARPRRTNRHPACLTRHRRDEEVSSYYWPLVARVRRVTK
jgi:hypothetical protein